MSVVREIAGYAVAAEIGVNNGPISGIAACEDGNRVAVTNSRADSVSIIDTYGRGVVATIAGTPEPFGIVVAGRRGYVRVASPTYDAIAVLELQAGSLAAMHPVAFGVTDLAVSPDGGRLYCSAVAGGRVDVAALDPTTGACDIVAVSAAPGSTAGSVRVSPDGRRLYVAARGPSSDQLVLMDARRLRVSSYVEIGSPIRDVAVSSDGDNVYVVSCSPDFGAVVDVIDSRSGALAATAKVTGTSGFVTQLSLSADGQRAYLVDDHGVTVLSTLTLDVIGSVAIGGSPSCAVEIARGTRLCVADHAGMVTVFSVPSTRVEPDDDITVGNAWAVPDRFDLTPAMA